MELYSRRLNTTSVTGVRVRTDAFRRHPAASAGSPNQSPEPSVLDCRSVAGDDEDAVQHDKELTADVALAADLPVGRHVHRVES